MKGLSVVLVAPVVVGVAKVACELAGVPETDIEVLGPTMTPIVPVQAAPIGQHAALPDLSALHTWFVLQQRSGRAMLLQTEYPLAQLDCWRLSSSRLPSSSSVMLLCAGDSWRIAGWKSVTKSGAASANVGRRTRDAKTIRMVGDLNQGSKDGERNAPGARNVEAEETSDVLRLSIAVVSERAVELL